MDDSTRRMRTVYDQIASEYAIRTAEMPADLVAFADRFLAWIDPNAPLLDLGCGPGRDMAWLEARGARVIGVDLSAGMLAQARLQVRGALAQMDMRRLAFPARCLGGVWCDAALLHLPKAEATHALVEMRRVLRPGGVLFLAVQEGAGEGWESGRFVAVERFFARYQPDELTAMLARAGFTIREQDRSQGGIRTWLQVLATSV